MKRLEDFRIYYNHTIHPELMRLERKRKRLLLLLFSAVFLLLATLFLQFYLNILVVSLFLMIPFGFYITFILFRIQRFKATFKPHVVNLILDFIDDGLSFGTLKYDSKQFISRERFISSRLFKTEAPHYVGEDHISGMIGELDFEMCELEVKEFSKVRNRLNYVFKGVFLRTTFNMPLKGEIIILPRKFKQYLSRSIKSFNSRGGLEVKGSLTKKFNDSFLTFATKNANVSQLLSTDMQAAIANYRVTSGKEIYVSFIKRDIYIGITEPKDILEPFIFSSNVSFDLVREFFEDIHVLISIIEAFDNNN
ncbi:MAG: hypothetical protein ACI8P3_000851 [Saprospiraceae bacterium]|jgi:hypothetical protein